MSLRDKMAINSFKPIQVTIEDEASVKKIETYPALFPTATENLKQLEDLVPEL